MTWCSNTVIQSEVQARPLGYPEFMAANGAKRSNLIVIQGLDLGRRGRRPGEQMMLKPWQCATIVNIIRDHTPGQLKMPFVLWDRVRELIQQKFGITLALRTVGDYLHRRNMTPQRLIERAYRQNPKEIKK